MSSKLKTVVLTVSLACNGLAVAFLAVTALSNPDMSLFSFPAAGEGYAASAAIAVLPASCGLVFNPLEIALRPSQEAFLQYSVLISRRQSNIFVNALYDPRIISVGHTGSGIAITALREGETLMQYISNDGIKDLCRVTVTE
jgi:hypothetical protein